MIWCHCAVIDWAGVVEAPESTTRRCPKSMVTNPVFVAQIRFLVPRTDGHLMLLDFGHRFGGDSGAFATLTIESITITKSMLPTFSFVYYWLIFDSHQVEFFAWEKQEKKLRCLGGQNGAIKFQIANEISVSPLEKLMTIQKLIERKLKG